MAVIRHQGELPRMVAIICHLATDGAGVMMREVASNASTPPAGIKQLEQARY